MKITGSLVEAFVFCPRQAWLMSRQIMGNQDHEFLVLGRLIHEDSYKRNKKEIFVDQLLKIDLLRNNLRAEVKKSSKHKKAATIQLAYYLYYLKHEKDIIMEGALLFPKEKKTEKIKLTKELEKQVKNLIEDMQQVLSLDKPPQAQKSRYCRACSFSELCWA